MPRRFVLLPAIPRCPGYAPRLVRKLARSRSSEGIVTLKGIDGDTYRALREIDLIRIRLQDNDVA